MECTAAQGRIVQHSRTRGASLIVDSCAGTGKGVVLAAVVRCKRAAAVCHLSLASTGCAAMRCPPGWVNGVSVPATTVHQKLTVASVRGFWARLKKIEFAEFSISIDEFAMLSAGAFHELQRIVDEHVPARKKFKVAYYLFGDVYQVESVEPSLLAGRTFWQWYKREQPPIFRLTEVLRSDADDEFYPRLYAALYAMPRCGVSVANILQERVLVSPPAPSNDCQWLTSTNAVRHRINDRWWWSYVSLRRNIRKLSELDGVDLAAALAAGGMASIPAAPSVCTFVTASGDAIAGGRLAVGMGLMCDKTVLDGDKYVVVKGERFICRSFGGTEHLSAKRKRGDGSVGPALLADKDAWIRATSVVHPSRGEHVFMAPCDSHGVWTIVPGAAVTIHKAQGSTIRTSHVIDVSGCKTFNELVTAGTRGTNVAHLFVRPFAFSHIVHLAGLPLNRWVQKFIGLPRE
jgi:hypothetical protein